MFGEEFFPLPEPQILGAATRVMSLRDGKNKMSKSDPSAYGCILLTDSADEIRDKIKKAKSDSDVLPSEPKGLEGRAEAKNLVSIYAGLSAKTEEEVLREFGGKGFGDFKPALAELAISKLEPISTKMTELLGDESYLDEVLEEGATKARAIASPVMEEVRQLVGFLGKRV